MRRLLDIAPEASYWAVVVILLGLSAAFAMDVEGRRGAWSTDKGAIDLANGAEVKVLQVIDGDEVSVAYAQGTVVVRLLGIKAFDPKVQEPGISAVGQACAASLERMTRSDGVHVVIRYDEAKADKAGRLLAYLHANDVDVGRALLEQGHALAYTRYPFSREQDYLSAEDVARTRGEGLWSSPRAAVRAEALKATWEAQRKDD